MGGSGATLGLCEEMGARGEPEQGMKGACYTTHRGFTAAPPVSVHTKSQPTTPKWQKAAIERLHVPMADSLMERY